jgi:hypothetical protein
MIMLNNIFFPSQSSLDMPYFLDLPFMISKVQFIKRKKSSVPSVSLKRKKKILDGFRQKLWFKSIYVLRKC